MDRCLQGSRTMTVQILMPALSPTMEEGAIAKWLVKEGDIVKAGDVIAEIETDKAIMELESYQDGKISKLLVLEGTIGVLVNSPIALFSEETDDSGNEEKQAGNQTKNLSVQNELVQEVPSKTKESKNVSTKNVEITVREALRDAMAEEMRSDKHVFLMGEEVAQYQGAYKVSQGLLDEFGAERVIDTPITEHGLSLIHI